MCQWWMLECALLLMDGYKLLIGCTLSATCIGKLNFFLVRFCEFIHANTFISFLKRGERRTWYIIPGDSAESFESYILTQSPPAPVSITPEKLWVAGMC